MATRAAVQALSADDLKTIGVQVLITNAFHLHLQPGEEVIRSLGGLHGFMGWSGPLMIDSGGFQIFSLGAGREQGVGKVAQFGSADHPAGRDKTAKKPTLVRVDEEGAEFTSYLDGSRHRFTPEKVVATGLEMGADLIMVLDQCSSPLHSRDQTREALDRTHRWALQSLQAFQMRPANGRALFGIVQGGDYEDLRRESARFIGSLDFDGLAIGGAMGESRAALKRVLDWTIPELPENKPRHLLGMGWVEDVLVAVRRGADLMDCVAPTRLALTGTFLHKNQPRFRLRIRKREYRLDPRPVEEDCTCPTCSRYSRAYLRHLFMAREPLGVYLAARHNLKFMEKLMADLRSAIREERLDQVIEEWANHKGEEKG